MDDRTRVQLEILRKQISESAAAEDFEHQATGGLIVDYLNQVINTETKKIMSEAYIADHKGYLNSRAMVAVAVGFFEMIRNKKELGAGAKEKKKSIEDNERLTADL